MWLFILPIDKYYYLNDEVKRFFVIKESMVYINEGKKEEERGVHR